VIRGNGLPSGLIRVFRPDRTGAEEDGGRDSDYFLFVKGNQPGLQQAIFSKVQDAGVTEITRTLQSITRDRTRMLSYLPL
jgi:hypothetical protein